MSVCTVNFNFKFNLNYIGSLEVTLRLCRPWQPLSRLGPWGQLCHRGLGLVKKRLPPLLRSAHRNPTILWPFGKS